MKILHYHINLNMLKVIHGLFSAWAIGSRMEQSGHGGNNRMEMRNMNTCKRKKKHEY